MNPRDAEFVVGDWSKPHELRPPIQLECNPDLSVIECSCGWRVTTGAGMASKLAEMHLNRAFGHTHT